METINGIISCTNILQNILQEYCEVLNRSEPDAISKMIISNDSTRYLVITEGWHNEQRIHSLIFDAEIRNNKIWLHHDGLDHGITEDLLTAGISKEKIVLAFHPPHIRQHTGYAIA